MNINLRFCKKCSKAYDIGTNFETCPECRLEKLNKKVKKNDNRHN